MDLDAEAYLKGNGYMDMFCFDWQKFQFSVSFTSFTKSLVIETLTLLSIFNGKDNKIVF